MVAAVGVGCGSGKYRLAADEEVYGILDDRRETILGATNKFRIDTDLSKRPVEEVSGGEVVRDRYTGGGNRTLTLAEALQRGCNRARPKLANSSSKPPPAT